MKKTIDKEFRNKIVVLSISLVFLVLGFFNWKDISGGQGFFMLFYYVNPSWVAIVLCGAPLFKWAVYALKNKKITVPVLVSVAMLAAIILEVVGFFMDMGDSGHSFIFAAGEIAFLMAVGGLIEDFTIKKCNSGIQRLVDLIPKEAFVKVGDRLEKRSLEDIKIGDVVLVKSGELISVDGEIVKGSCSVDQSSVTGEYVPVDLSVKDRVYGGTININGTIEIEVAKLLKDMTIAKMADLVREAEEKKAPIARTADKAVSIIVPSLFLLSLAVGLIAAFALKVGTVESIVRAITVLIVFCPCAFALATPTAIAAGVGNAARKGVLIKSGASLEELSRIDTICFDKTGTLTEGKIELSDIVIDDFDKTELLKLVASVEKYSEHPLAVAVLNNAKDLVLYEASEILTVSGVGISAVVNDKKVAIENLKSIKKSGYMVDKFESDISSFFAQGKTVVGVTVDEKLVGIMAFSDTIRQGAKQTIEILKSRNYEPVMLTGDNKESAEFVGALCGIDNIKFELLPEDKLIAIKEMQTENKKVCMVGDGINDAPSLKLANVSIAMVSMGSDIALDSADMAILNSDIRKIKHTISLSKRVMKTIKLNIVLAMSINAIAVVASMFGFLNPVTGALVHNLTSILVILSSALLLKNSKKEQSTQLSI